MRHNKVHRRPLKQVRVVTVPVQFSDTFSSINPGDGPCTPRHVTWCRPRRRRRRRRTCRCTKLAAGYASLMHLGRTGQLVHCTSAGDGTARRHVTVVACVGSDHQPCDRWMGSSSATTSWRSLACVRETVRYSPKRQNCTRQKRNTPSKRWPSYRGKCEFRIWFNLIKAIKIQW